MTVSVLMVLGALWCAVKAWVRGEVALRLSCNPPPEPQEYMHISLHSVRPTIMAAALERRVRQRGWTPERLTLALQLGPAARVPLGLSYAA